MRYIISFLLVAITTVSARSQQLNTAVTAFCRSGIYAGLNNIDVKDPFQSLFGDAGVKADVRNGTNFRAYADLRYRNGIEFRENVSSVLLREAWVSVYGEKIEFTMGQRIVKWGHADFDNPMSSWNPRNMIVRSPEREDMDIGNIIASVTFRPAPFLSIEALTSPAYRPDVLITTPLDMPGFVTFNTIDGYAAGKSMSGYGVRAGVFLRGIDMSLSYFSGNDLLPGIMLSDWNLEVAGDEVSIDITLDATPFRIRRYGAGFETSAGRFGLRGEVAYTDPVNDFRDAGYIAMPEVKWAAGADVSAGIFTLGAEWSGKYITDFEASPADPVVPGNFPPLTPEMITLIPGGAGTFLEMQITAFNRLYRYQLEKSYHTIAARAEADIAAGRLLPGIVAHYNITSGDLALVPAVKFRPADGLTMVAGADLYKGREGSLFDILDAPLTNLFLSLRVDF